MGRVLMRFSKRSAGFISLVLLIFSAFTMWQFTLYFCELASGIFCNAPYQALVDLERIFPAMLMALVFIDLTVSIFNVYRCDNPRKRAKRARNLGIRLLVCGAAMIVYVPAALAAGWYYSLIEGSPSALFPLDMMLIGALFLVLGLKFAKKDGQVTGTSCSLPGSCGLLMRFSFMISAASLGGFFWGFSVLDWYHGSVLFNIALMLNYLAAAIMVICYRYVYAETAPKKRAGLQVKLPLILLIVNAAALALYFISLSLDPNAGAINACGIMPLENFAGYHVFMIFVGGNNILTPLIALITGAVRKAKDAKPKK